MAGALAGLGPWFGGALGSGFQTLSAGLLDYNNGVANAPTTFLAIQTIVPPRVFRIDLRYAF